MTPPLHELLLIDDNPADVDLVRHTVRRLGLPVHVSIARDAEGATGMVRERVGISVQLPDLVLADLNLPGQSGLEMIAEWKTDPALQLVPIVVLSSSRNPAEVRETYRLGCAGVPRQRAARRGAAGPRGGGRAPDGSRLTPLTRGGTEATRRRTRRR